MFKPAAIGRTALLGAAAMALAAIAQPLAAATVEIEFDVANFPDAANLTNPYLSYGVGDTFVYKAETADGCEWSVVSVEGTEPIDVDPGPATTILNVREVQDLEYEDEACDGPDDSELVEQTLDWFGQDEDGNVWYFGEDTQDCEGVGNCEPGEGAWRAFEDGALPGIIMLGDPDSGERYRQEFAEDVAEDWGMVMNLNRRVRLRGEDAFPPGTWSNCLITKEWNGLEPGSVEQKTYCPNVGLVLVTEHSGRLVRFELQDPDVDTDALQFRQVK